MMKEFDFFISGTVLFMLFVWAAGIFIVFRLAKKYIPLVAGKKVRKETLLFYFSVAEAIVWGGFFVLASTVLIKKSLFVGIAFLIFVLVLGLLVIFLYFRDYISGLVVKMERNIAEGDYVYGKEFEGRIRKLNVRNVEIETEDAEITVVPYYKFLQDVVRIRKPGSDGLQSYSFVFEVDNDKIADFQAFKSELLRFLISLPWVKANPVPDIIMESENENKVRVTVYPLMIKFVYQIEKACTERFGKHEEEN